MLCRIPCLCNPAVLLFTVPVCSGKSRSDCHSGKTTINVPLPSLTRTCILHSPSLSTSLNYCITYFQIRDKRLPFPFRARGLLGPLVPDARGHGALAEQCDYRWCAEAGHCNFIECTCLCFAGERCVNGCVCVCSNLRQWGM